MATNNHQQGNLIQADFLTNVGGINTADSAFAISDNQCLEGYNFDYISTGGIRKRRGMTPLITSPDGTSKTFGINLYIDANNNKTLIRAGGSNIQTLNSATYIPTNIADDTMLATQSFLDSASLIPVCFTQFSNASATVLWLAGAGLTLPMGVTSTTKLTVNGAVPPTGSITQTNTSTVGNLANGAYTYTLLLYKNSTGALSNVLDSSFESQITVSSNYNVNLNLSSITKPDTTKYPQYWIYRSKVAGLPGFTVGDLIAKVGYNGTTYTLIAGGGTLSTSTYQDNGSSIAPTINIPRANNTILDNSVLPTGTYNSVVNFKNRLVTASGNTFYISDLNKSESWPTGNQFIIPSGGNITGMAVLYFNTPTTSSTDEYLVLFKEREMWVFTGDSIDGAPNSSGTLTNVPWQLKFVDNIGCPGQGLIVNANGAICWIAYRGVYLWHGTGKPIYLSRLIEPEFQDNGDVVKTLLSQGVGAYYQNYNQIIWFLSHLTKGTQQFMLKLDLRLTIPQFKTDVVSNQIIDGVFSFDYQSQAPLYSSTSIIPPGDTAEYIFVGDNAGQIYKMYNGTQDASLTTLDFNYKTKFIDFGLTGVAKRIHKVLVYTQDVGGVTLSLNYWANYRTSPNNLSQKQAVSPISGTTALWDQGIWDTASWDDYSPSINTLTFNLSSEGNNAEGDSIQLQFQQTNYNSPLVIYGYSIIYSILGTRH